MYHTSRKVHTKIILRVLAYTYIGNEKPKLKDLNDYVAVNFATNWKQLGRNLDIREDLLKIIEKNYPQDCEECCSKMLNEWLELTPNATWGIILEVLDKIPSSLENHEGS